MKPPSLLCVTSGFPPEQVGGIEQHSLEVSRALRDLGVRIGFYSRGERADVPEHGTYRTDHDDFPVTRVVHRWSGARSLRHIYDDENLVAVFRRFLHDHRPELVHVHHLGGIGASCLQVTREAGIPLVMTLHDYGMMCPRGQMFHAELRACDRVSAEQCTPCIAATWPHLVPEGDGEPFHPSLPPCDNRASVAAFQDWLRGLLTLPDQLLTASDAVRERFIEFGVSPDRIRTEEYGQDQAPFANLSRTASGKLRVGFVGTLIPSKGVHVLLEAFAQLPPGTASLLIAGNAPPFHQCTDYGDRVRSLVARVPRENPVELLGTYEHDDLPALLSGIDVLVVPPLWHEAYGLTLREGLLAGCAVLSSRVGGLPQAVREGENGFTFAPGDVDALAGLLQRFLEDPGLAVRLGRAPNRIRSAPDMARSLLANYEALGARLG